MKIPSLFESSVNPEGYKTGVFQRLFFRSFESSVNPEGYKTRSSSNGIICAFESSVNPEGYKTYGQQAICDRSLRAV